MAYKVIDISEHNASVDFTKLSVDAVVLRVGYRGYGEQGKIVSDKKFKEYIEQANKNHIPVGVYFYSQAITSAEAKAEAKYVVNALKGYNIDLPVYFDAEYAERNGDFVGRLYKAKISKSKLTKIAQTFCDTILVYGYLAGVYASYDFFKNKYEVRSLKKYSLWVAHYSTTNLPKLAGAKFDMWQFTDDSKVKGVTGMVDMNQLYTDMIWRECKTTVSLNYRNERSLDTKCIVGTLKKGATVYAKAGSDVYVNGYNWVTVKRSPDDNTYYVAKQYLRSV